jgi:hypothetical protein
MFSISPVFFWANIYVPADFEDYCVNTLKKTALLSVLDAPTITLREVYATKLIGFKNDAQQLNAGSVVNIPLLNDRYESPKKILLGIHCGCRGTERSPSCYIQDRSRLKAAR